jgi:hypothetical protein
MSCQGNTREAIKKKSSYYAAYSSKSSRVCFKHIQRAIGEAVQIPPALLHESASRDYLRTTRYGMLAYEILHVHIPCRKDCQHRLAKGIL